MYLFTANAALRLVRGFFVRDGDVASAGFEVGLSATPTQAEAEHALGALSVAARHCAQELQALLNDPALADLYRRARC